MNAEIERNKLKYKDFPKGNFLVLFIDSVGTLVVLNSGLRLGLMDAAEGNVLLHSLPVSGVAQGIDHGVVGGAGLGQQGGEHRHQRSDGRLVKEQTLNSHGAVWSPAQDPESHVEDGAFGNSHLGALSFLATRSEVGDIHFLSLRPHGGFMAHDSLHDEEVEVDESHEGNNVGIDEYEDTV